MSTGARRLEQFWRLSQLWFVDKSIVDVSQTLSHSAIFCRQEHSWRPLHKLRRHGGGLSVRPGNLSGRPGAVRRRHKALFVLSTRIRLRQEQCSVDKSIPGGPSEQPGRPGKPVWATGAAWESVWAAWCPFDIATRLCFVDKSNVDRSKIATGEMFCRQEHSWRPVWAGGTAWEARLGRRDGLGGLSGLFGREQDYDRTNVLSTGALHNRCFIDRSGTRWGREGAVNSGQIRFPPGSRLGGARAAPERLGTAGDAKVS